MLALRLLFLRFLVCCAIETFFRLFFVSADIRREDGGALGMQTWGIGGFR
jgi:hypothetical protein